MGCCSSFTKPFKKAVSAVKKTITAPTDLAKKAGGYAVSSLSGGGGGASSSSQTTTLSNDLKIQLNLDSLVEVMKKNSVLQLLFQKELHEKNATTTKAEQQLKNDENTISSLTLKEQIRSNKALFNLGLFAVVLVFIGFIYKKKKGKK